MCLHLSTYFYQALRLGSDFRPPVPQSSGGGGGGGGRDRDNRGLSGSSGRSSGSLKLSIPRGTGDRDGGLKRPVVSSSSQNLSHAPATGHGVGVEPASTFKIQFR